MHSLGNTGKADDNVISVRGSYTGSDAFIARKSPLVVEWNKTRGVFLLKIQGFQLKSQDFAQNVTKQGGFLAINRSDDVLNRNQLLFGLGKSTESRKTMQTTAGVKKSTTARSIDLVSLDLECRSMTTR